MLHFIKQSSCSYTYRMFVRFMFLIICEKYKFSKRILLFIFKIVTINNFSFLRLII